MRQVRTNDGAPSSFEWVRAADKRLPLLGGPRLVTTTSSDIRRCGSTNPLVVTCQRLATFDSVGNASDAGSTPDPTGGERDAPSRRPTKPKMHSWAPWASKVSGRPPSVSFTSLAALVWAGLTVISPGVIDAALVMVNDDVARVDKEDGGEIGVDRDTDGLRVHLSFVVVTPVTLSCVGTATASSAASWRSTRSARGRSRPSC
jgi:hypothetical protein